MKRMSIEIVSNKLERISRALLEAKTFYEMWWVLCGPTRPKYVDIMNAYGIYSRALITTTFYTTVTALYKVTDNHSHNLNDLFKDLPKEQFTEQDIKLYQKVLTENHKIICAVRILRNNVFGHNSVNLNYEASFEKAGFVPDECKQYIADLAKMVSEIYTKLEKPISETYFESTAADELESVFQTLKDHAANAA